MRSLGETLPTLVDQYYGAVFNPSAKLSSILDEWESLDCIEFVMMIEESMYVELPDDFDKWLFENDPTLQEVITKVDTLIVSDRSES